MAISISRWTITSRRSHGVRLLIEVHSVAARALRVYNTRRVTEEMQAAFTIKFVQLGAALLWLATDWTTAQDQDLVRSCAAYKKSVFEETSEFSLLYLNAPIIYKTRDTCSSYTPLIIGGGAALPKEFPHAARLGNRDEDNEIDWFCGGTLISNLHVLTAAHCLYSENGAVNVVRLGELEFDNDKDDADPEDFGVANSTVHPGYAHPIIYNDIALLRLSRPVTFNEYKHPACLPFHDGSSDQTFIAIGWGQVKVVSESSKKLRKVRLNNYGTRCSTTSEPNEELPNGYNGTTQICIGSKEHKDTCNGDSGGPVLTYHKDFPCMYHVMGITSTGNFCDTPDFPGLYTRVHQYLDWIKAEMAKTS